MMAVATAGALAATTPTNASSSVPRYDHVFLIILENNGYNQIIGNSYAPVLNGLAHAYGLATNYHGVADPSEPNYVAMLGGSAFGITNDNPYWYPGNTVNSANLMSQLNAHNETWTGYYQGMPYAGYRGYCYPDKCNGIPDADTQYVSKHNGVVNFANLQTPSEFANMKPLGQLSNDLANGTLANLSYIVPDECHDMHGAPPWCVDSGNTGTLQQDWLIAEGDQFVHGVVQNITASTTWTSGEDAIVVTFDEGNQASSRIATIVITNHGPRGMLDSTRYNHYSLLATLEKAFGVGCLLNSCRANVMTPLFSITGSSGVPALAPPYAFPTGHDQVFPEGFAKKGAAVSLGGAAKWSVVPSVSFNAQDNVLAGVSAASAKDAWAVGQFYPSTGAGVLATLGEHFDGTRWTAYPLPDVGVEENSLLGVSMPGPGTAWAVGYYVSGTFEQRALVEHFHAGTWSVVPSPDPSSTHNILYGVGAITDSDVWVVGAATDAQGVWQTLAEHWNGTAWSVVTTKNPGPRGDQFYAVTAVAANDVYAVGQAAGAGFPSQALIEHWNGTRWSVLTSPSDPAASALPLGVAAQGSTLAIVGQQENDTAGYAPYVATGGPRSFTRVAMPSATPSENDLFGVTMVGNGSIWAVGWAIYNPANATHVALILHYSHGVWTLVASPGFGRGADSGLSGIAAIPGGGLWAVGVTASASGSYQTVIEYYP